METTRMEAFSDGVLAIVITIMVLELRVPPGGDLSSLRPILPVFLSYLLSFTYLGIYWTNHHHMLQATQRVSGGILWANLHLLFWLSLVPATTAWMGENHLASWPTALYAVVLFMAGVAYFLLERAIVAFNGKSSALGSALGRSGKEVVSVVVYFLAIGLAFVHTALSQGLFVLAAAMWVVPDRRIERALRGKNS